MSMPHTGCVSYLVRHGESVANAGEPTRDVMAISLTKLGREQADAVAWSIPVCSRAISSDYARAIETARPYARACGLEVETMAALREFTYLDLGGEVTTPEQRKARVNEYWERADPDWNDSARDNPNPCVESYNDFIRRVLFIIDMIKNSPEPVVLFTHGNFMKVFMRAVDGGDLSMKSVYGYLYSTGISNCAIMDTDGESYSFFSAQ